MTWATLQSQRKYCQAFRHLDLSNHRIRLKAKFQVALVSAVLLVVEVEPRGGGGSVGRSTIDFGRGWRIDPNEFKGFATDGEGGSLMD